MQRRVGVLFVTAVLLFFVLAACRTPTAGRGRRTTIKAAINVVLAHEKAVPGGTIWTRWILCTHRTRVVIEDSYPHPFEPDEAPKAGKSTRTLGTTSPMILRAPWPMCGVNVAWVTLALHSVWNCRYPCGPGHVWE